MAVKSGFFMSVNGDRRYDTAFFAEYFSSFIGNGVFPNPSNNLQVVEGNNMQTVVKAGKAWINGYYLHNDSDLVLQHGVAHGTMKRIDRIVVRWNVLTRQMVIEILKGTNATSPVAPKITRNTNYYDLVLADVYINAGTVQLTQANITDQRLNSALCGVVTQTVKTVDTTTLFNQYQSWLTQQKASYETDMTQWSNTQKANFTAWRTQEETNFNNWKTSRENSFDSWQQAEQRGFTTWQAQERANFDAWFARVQAVLDGNIVTNLQNQINSITTAKLNVLNRTNYTVNSLPADYPVGITTYHETRVTQYVEWLNALGVSTKIVAPRLEISTRRANSEDSIYTVAVQEITLYRNTADDYEFVAKYIRTNKYDAIAQKNAWGAFEQIATIDDVTKLATSITTSKVEAHSNLKNNPHNVTSAQVNLLDRANYTANSLPSDFPLGYTTYYETRTGYTGEWAAVLGQTLWSGARFLIEIWRTVQDASDFEVHKQRVTYYSNLVDNPGSIRGIYERVNARTEGDFDAWGDWYAVMTEKGGQFADIVKAHNNTSYTVAQIRNSIFSTSGPENTLGNNGDMWIKYK